MAKEWAKRILFVAVLVFAASFLIGDQVPMLQMYSGVVVDKKMESIPFEEGRIHMEYTLVLDKGGNHFRNVSVDELTFATINVGDKVKKTLGQSTPRVVARSTLHD
jgi:hypothetical protein